MKILLAEPRYYTYDRQPYFPLGPAYVAAALLQAGHAVLGLNANTTPGSAEDFAATAVAIAAREGCKAVAMGGLCTTFVFQRQVFRAVRALAPDLTLISGGNLFSSEPALCMEQFGLDFGVLGEGEATMLALADALEAGTDAAALPGVVSRREGRTRFAPAREVIRDLDTLPFPAHHVFQSPEAIAAAGAMTIYTSRSCPFRCTFCYHPKGSVYRKRSVPHVMAEIRYLHETYGITRFGFGDELFALDKTWTHAFCDALERLPFLEPWTCQMRASDADPAVLVRMRQAGCFQISMGFESGSEAVLASMKKKITTAVSRRAIANARAAGLPVTGGIILGDFAETPGTVRQTLDFIKETSLVPVSDIGLIVPYPGSTIYERCLDQGLIADKTAFIESLGDFGKLRVNMTGMADAELLALQEWASREYYAHSLAHRRGTVAEVVADTPASARLTIACQTCGGRFPLDLHGPQFEIQRYCPHCHYPVFVDPFDVPYIDRATSAFRRAMAAFGEDAPGVWGTPVGIEFLRLSHGLGIPDARLRGFLDRSRERLEHPFLGRPVRPRDRETLREIAPAVVVVVSARYQKAILAELAGMDLANITVLPLFSWETADDGV